MSAITRVFWIEGSHKSTVFNVGVRPSATYYGNACYGLKMTARNIPAANGKADRVEIIVQGEEESISRFYDYVKNHDIRQIKKDDQPTVSLLQAYKGEEPSWIYNMAAVTNEQIYKGFGLIAELIQKMDDSNRRSEENRRKDLARAEENRRKDLARAEENRRKDLARAEENRRKDLARAEENRKEDLEASEQRWNEAFGITKNILNEAREERLESSRRFDQMMAEIRAGRESAQHAADR